MIIVDVETTGLDPGVNAIVSIGAIELESRKEFYAENRVDPERVDISPRALEINGFSHAQVVDPTKQPLSASVTQFNQWASQFRDRTLCAHNARFDFGFLQAAFDEVPMKWPFGYRTVDIHSLTYAVAQALGHPPRVYKGVSALGLNKCLAFFGLPPEPDPHNALTGARCNLQVYLAVQRAIQSTGENLSPETHDGYHQMRLPDA